MHILFTYAGMAFLVVEPSLFDSNVEYAFKCIYVKGFPHVPQSCPEGVSPFFN